MNSNDKLQELRKSYNDLMLEKESIQMDLEEYHKIPFITFDAVAKSKRLTSINTKAERLTNQMNALAKAVEIQGFFPSL